MSKFVTYLGTVYPWQCDHVGHMNVMWYVRKFDEATWNFFHQLGLTPPICGGKTAAWRRFSRPFSIAKNWSPAT